MRNFVSLFSISVFLLLVWTCNPLFEHREEKQASIKEVSRDVYDGKAELAANLRDLSNKIELRVAEINRQMDTASDASKRTLIDMRRRLNRQKTKVGKSLKEIEGATTESWEKIKVKSERALTDARIEAQKVEERMENLVN